jgi:hypothetical protein
MSAFKMPTNLLLLLLCCSSVCYAILTKPLVQVHPGIDLFPCEPSCTPSFTSDIMAIDARKKVAWIPAENGHVLLRLSLTDLVMFEWLQTNQSYPFDKCFVSKVTESSYCVYQDRRFGSSMTIFKFDSSCILKNHTVRVVDMQERIPYSSVYLLEASEDTLFIGKKI